jgi:hypothetical protein
MAESFLEEQIRRIRQLSEWMSSVQNRVAELSGEMVRDRELAYEGPLYEIRDFRIHQPELDDEPAGRRPAASESRRKRRRR